MIIPRLGKWTMASGRHLVWERLYLHGHKWTPLCRVRFRNLKTVRESMKPMGLPAAID
jgi:hypothetical protein